jgi:hypothetical protein
MADRPGDHAMQYIILISGHEGDCPKQRRPEEMMVVAPQGEPFGDFGIAKEFADEYRAMNPGLRCVVMPIEVVKIAHEVVT